MNSAVSKWLFFRAVRWLAWIGFFLYSAHFIAYRQEHINSFGQLVPATEAGLFGFATAAVFAGFLELMMRERAGLDRPKPLRLMAPRASGSGPAATPLR
ncbi:MAG: hypothetical protein K2Y27_14045 [Xanthobacteraceae bacterium]|nr:hypothetical protein [Xanthobacteraceae bacterium]